jgi:natural product precursor
MKKVKFTGKLSLNKETIAKLNDEQMNMIKGGEAEVRSRRSHCAKNPCTFTAVADDAI